MAKPIRKPEYQFVIVSTAGNVQYVKDEADLKQILADCENSDVDRIFEIKRDVGYNRVKVPDVITLV